MPSPPDPNSHDADAACMLRLAKGDMQALAPLMQRHQRKVMALAWRMLRRDDLAEDVAQDVFLRVAKSAGRYRPEAKFTTWLYRITSNRCLDELRRKRRGTISLDDAPPPTAERNQDDLERRERTARVRRAIDALPDRQKLAVVLHRYETLSHRDIAEVTGWSPKAVESLLVRAYDKLRDALADLRE